MPKENIVYILKCSDHTLYTGWTSCLEHRVKMHQFGKGAKYTKSRLPVQVVYTEALPDKKTAMKREYAIKQMNRAEKLTLIAQYKNNQ